MAAAHVTIRSKPPSDDFATLQFRFGATVKSFRIGLGLSQEELAWRASMHRTYLADIERGGRNISLTRIARLVQALGITLPDFFAALAKASPAINSPTRRSRARAKSS